MIVILALALSAAATGYLIYRRYREDGEPLADTFDERAEFIGMDDPRWTPGVHPIPPLRVYDERRNLYRTLDE